MTSPDLSDRASFPAFAETPTAAGRHVLLGEMKENMTIMRPTYILADRDQRPFAVTFMLAATDAARPRFKKGAAVAVVGLPRAAPDGNDESKKGCVRVECGREARVVVLGAASLQSVLDGMLARDRAVCAGAGCKKTGEAELKKCTSCGWVRYCGKECQTEAWTNGGHKTECKAFRKMQSVLDLQATL